MKKIYSLLLLGGLLLFGAESATAGMYLRGGMNDWGGTPMTEISTGIWVVDYTATSSGTIEFKFSTSDSSWPENNNYGGGKKYTVNSKDRAYKNGANTSFDAVSGTKYYFILDLTTDNYEYSEVATAFTITYDDNEATSGSAPSDAAEYYHDYNTATAAANTGNLKKTGYQFVGWNTNKSGSGTTYAVGAEINAIENVTLHAKWAQEHTVTYDANGGTGAQTDPDKYISGQTTTVKDAGTIEKAGYQFTGWNTKTDGNGTSYAVGATLTFDDADVILYAQWTEIHTVYFYDNMDWGAVYVNFYVNNYWDTYHNPSYGSGNNGAAICNQSMTRIAEGSNIWKFDFIGDYQYMSFTSASQYDEGAGHGYDNFYGLPNGAVFRNDFNTASANNKMMYVPNSTPNGTYNGVKYYSDGAWIYYDSHALNRVIGTDHFGSVCVPVDATISNATLYTVLGKDASTLYLQENTGAAATNLTGGTTYFYKASASTQTITLKATGFAGSPSTDNGLYGTFATTAVPNNEGYYVLSNDNLLPVDNGSCNVAAYRVYVKVSAVGNYSTQAPGRPIVGIVYNEENATNIEAIEAQDSAIKFFQNGNLYIIRDGVTYDATGRVVR